MPTLLRASDSQIPTSEVTVPQIAKSPTAAETQAIPTAVCGVRKSAFERADEPEKRPFGLEIAVGTGGTQTRRETKLLNLVDAASANTRADIGDGKGATRKTCKDQRGVFGSVIAASLGARGRHSDKESKHESKG
jgi:hypothetical protein